MLKTTGSPLQDIPITAKVNGTLLQMACNLLVRPDPVFLLEEECLIRLHAQSHKGIQVSRANLCLKATSALCTARHQKASGV